jgi:hypothetical protein
MHLIFFEIATTENSCRCVVISRVRARSDGNKVSLLTSLHLRNYTTALRDRLC